MVLLELNACPGEADGDARSTSERSAQSPALRSVMNALVDMIVLKNEAIITSRF